MAIKLRCSGVRGSLTKALTPTLAIGLNDGHLVSLRGRAGGGENAATPFISPARAEASVTGTKVHLVSDRYGPVAVVKTAKKVRFTKAPVAMIGGESTRPILRRPI